MKRIAYCFLLIFLLSCGSSPSSSNYHIKIEFRDSVSNDYYLLAVRENALVITPYTTDYDSIDSLNAKAELVPFAKIARLYKTSSASLEDELWFGGTALGISGCYSAFLYTFSGVSGHGGTPKFDVAFPLGATGGGLLLGLLVNNSYQELYLDTPEHLEKVKSRACYKEGDLEPPELRNIK
ncbi:MAG: hypothetical protein ABI778_01535 [Ignavibacteriota bacterium]